LSPTANGINWSFPFWFQEQLDANGMHWDTSANFWKFEKILDAKKLSFNKTVLYVAHAITDYVKAERY